MFDVVQRMEHWRTLKMISISCLLMSVNKLWTWGSLDMTSETVETVSLCIVAYLSFRVVCYMQLRIFSCKNKVLLVDGRLVSKSPNTYCPWYLTANRNCGFTWVLWVASWGRTKIWSPPRHRNKPHCLTFYGNPGLLSLRGEYSK